MIFWKDALLCYYYTNLHNNCSLLIVSVIVAVIIPLTMSILVDVDVVDVFPIFYVSKLYFLSVILLIILFYSISTIFKHTFRAIEVFLFYFIYVVLVGRQ